MSMVALLDPTLKFFSDKWGKRLPELVEANSIALKAGFNLGIRWKLQEIVTKSQRHPFNLGFIEKFQEMKLLFTDWIAGAQQADRELLYAGYPITPASPILRGFPP